MNETRTEGVVQSLFFENDARDVITSLNILAVRLALFVKPGKG